VELDAISAEQFDQLVANERSTRAQTEARRASVDQARLDLSYCTVRALASGQISRTQVYEGTLVGPSVNNRMTNIQVLDPIWVQFYPIAADIPALRGLMESGKPEVEVSMRPGEWRRMGRVVFIDNQVDPTTDTILARVQVANADLAVVPGAYVQVRMPVRTLKDAVTVPETALVFQTAAALVWTIEKDGTAKSRVVEVGPHGGSGVVITSGLSPGERVITAGQLKLRDGAPVMEAPPPGAPQGHAAPDGTHGRPPTKGAPGADEGGAKAPGADRGGASTPATGSAGA
jgi:RND family efflux transporter MFP subunit